MIAKVITGRGSQKVSIAGRRKIVIYILIVALVQMSYKTKEGLNK
jgi:hypothetical protein